MWGAAVKLGLWLLGLFGIGKSESEAEARERLTREAEEAKTKAAAAKAAEEAARKKKAAEDRLKEIATKPPEKKPLKPGDGLFLLVIGLAVCFYGCAGRLPPPEPPGMAQTCPEIPLPNRPLITIPEPDAQGRYCYSEEELRAIQDYAVRLRALIEEYNQIRSGVGQQ